MTVDEALRRLMGKVPDLAPGHVWLAGAGPGDAGHLTLHAIAGLAQADVVLHDALVSRTVLALAKPEAELVPAGKRCGRPSSEQTTISAALVAEAKAGRRVLRLKGGDPFVFGRGGEEVLALAEAGIPFRVIPGLTAGLAGLAAAMIPATMRGINQAIIFATGHGAESQHASLNWEAMASLGQPIVLYMGARRIGTIARRLMAGGMPANLPAALILDATRPEQNVTVTDLGHIAETVGEGDEESPALIVIGRIVSLRAMIAQAKQELLFEKRSKKLSLIIAAPRSGSGKTTITLALAAAFRRQGLGVAVAKSGPDYIDPAFHAAATGRPAFNLDSWAMPPAVLDGLLNQAAEDADLVLIEASMGLFDGAGPKGQAGRAADLAARWGLPVVLVLDVSGQSQTAAASARGFIGFEPGVTIAGVILNRLGSAKHEAGIRPAMAAIGLPVLGSLTRDAAIALPERHLGLVQAEETGDLAARIARLADLAETRFDLDAIHALAAPILAEDGVVAAIAPPGQRIAVARDAAFSFVYPHLLAGWREAGAEIRTFSPLADEPPPEDCDACWLPGGYPELYGPQLAAAGQFIAQLRLFAETRPVHGECGGYMVLGRTLTDAAGAPHRMAGLLDHETSFARRQLHLGYRRARLLADGPLGRAGSALRGHEFHYATIAAAGTDAAFVQLTDAHGTMLGPAGSRRGWVTGSFFHLIAQEDRSS